MTATRRGALYAAGVASALGLFSAIYRVRLFGGLLARPQPGTPPPGAHYWPHGLSFLLGDLALAAALAAVVGLVVGGGSALLRAAPAWPRRIAGGCGWLLLALLLLAVGALFQAHLSVLRSMQTGLSVDLLQEALTFAGAGAVEYSAHVGIADLLFVASPLLLAAALVLPPWRLTRWIHGCVVLLALAVALLNALYLLVPRRAPAPAIGRNPLVFLALDARRELRTDDDSWPPLPLPPPRRARVARRAAAGTAARATVRMPFAKQLRSVRLIHPAFVGHDIPGKALPPAATRPAQRWNVLFVLMESTGRDYAYKPTDGKLAMPFLDRLAATGLKGMEHFSPSNSSPRSIFALFSGLYPMPERSIYSVKRKLFVPSIFTLLPSEYETLFVTSTAASWFFPRDFMRRRGPRRLFSYENLHRIKRNSPGTALAKHEVLTVDFFLQQLDRIRHRPFFAVYYTFVAHWPYPDFGDKYRRFWVDPAKPYGKLSDDEKRLRYLNNLYLLDRQIERMYRFLEQRKLLSRTIIALVGDHGEAFGQHPNNWTHSRNSFNENYQTPLVLHQPALFPARRVLRRTSHVDVMPTLLEALNVPYNPDLVQGESLFRSRFRRRYLFLWGNERTISSVSRAGSKLQVSRRKLRCWVYDLRQDPRERRRLRCTSYPQQYRTTLLFQRYQRKLLRRYNRACRRRAPFHGRMHPQLVNRRSWRPPTPRVRRRRRRRTRVHRRQRS